MVDEQEIQKIVRDGNGNYCTLELTAYYTDELDSDDRKLLEQHSDYPNSSKYYISSINSELGIPEMALIHDEETSEAAIALLKKIHSISDPWD